LRETSKSIEDLIILDEEQPEDERRSMTPGL